MILYRFRVIPSYLSLSKAANLSLASKNESLGYCAALFASSYISPFCYNTGVWQTDAHTHRQTHDDGIYRRAVKIYVVASQSFFEVCLLPFSSRLKWSTVVDCGLLIISNLPWSIWLSFVLCRRFDHISLSPFWVVAVLVSPFWLSPFWFVAILTRHPKIDAITKPGLTLLRVKIWKTRHQISVNIRTFFTLQFPLCANPAWVCWFSSTAAAQVKCQSRPHIRTIVNFSPWRCHIGHKGTCPIDFRQLFFFSLFCKCTKSDNDYVWLSVQTFHSVIPAAVVI